MSPEARRRIGRGLFAAGYLFAWLGYGMQFAHASHIANPAGLTLWFNLDFLMGEQAYWVASLTWAVLGVLFAIGVRPATVATLLFCATFVYARVEETYDPGQELVTHGKFLPGVGMFAYALGAWWGRRTGKNPDQLGAELMCGAVAALYVWAGVVKLMASGLSWAHDANLSLLILERAYVAPSAMLSSIRMAFGTAPNLALVLGNGAIFIELLGVLMVVPRLRLAFVGTVSCMHLIIGTLMGYYYIEWVMCNWGLVIWTSSYPDLEGA